MMRKYRCWFGFGTFANNPDQVPLMSDFSRKVPGRGLIAGRSMSVRHVSNVWASNAAYSTT
jgi:hypothetical protein